MVWVIRIHVDVIMGWIVQNISGQLGKVPYNRTRKAKQMLGTWHYYYLNTTAVHYWDISDCVDLYLNCIIIRASHTRYCLNGIIEYANLSRCLIIIGCSVQDMTWR